MSTANTPPDTGYRFLFSGRWMRYIALAVIAAIACLLLADWQDRRREQRDAEIERIERNYHGEVHDVEEVLGSRTAALDEEDEWTRVSLQGAYQPELTVLARNRSLNQQAGFYVVVPFRTDAEETIAVVRGWIPTSDTGAVPDASTIPAPPSGPTTVEMWLRPKQDGSDDDNPPGVIRAIDPAVIPGLEQPFTEVYGHMASESPAAAESIEELPPPSTSPGSHLSYTFQWIAFSIMILIGLIVAVRRERQALAQRTADGQDPAAQAQEFVVVDKELLDRGVRPQTAPRYGGRARPKAAAPRRGPTEEELEDALLDAQGW